MLRHLLEPFDFSLEETERLLTVASHIQQNPTLYQDVEGGRQGSRGQEGRRL